MCVQTQFMQKNDQNIFASVFHADVANFEQAELKLIGQAPGSFLTFSANGQNYCSAVGKNNEIVHNPFRWDVKGGWYNGSPTFYTTEEALLDHMVDGQPPIPFYN